MLPDSTACCGEMAKKTWTQLSHASPCVSVHGWVCVPLLCFGFSVGQEYIGWPRLRLCLGCCQNDSTTSCAHCSGVVSSSLVRSGLRPVMQQCLPVMPK